MTIITEEGPDAVLVFLLKIEREALLAFLFEDREDEVSKPRTCSSLGREIFPTSQPGITIS